MRQNTPSLIFFNVAPRRLEYRLYVLRSRKVRVTVRSFATAVALGINLAIKQYLTA